MSKKKTEITEQPIELGIDLVGSSNLEKFKVKLEEGNVQYDRSTRKFWWPAANAWVDSVHFAQTFALSLPKGHIFKGQKAALTIVNDYIIYQDELAITELKKKFSIVDVENGTAEIRRALSIYQQKKIEEVNELDVYAIKAWLWQAKRKLYGFYDVDYPIMLIFYGKGQGSGKSKFVEKLTAPFYMSRSSVSVDSLRSPFNWDVFHKYYIVRFDELNFKHIGPNINADMKKSITDSEHTMAEKNKPSQTYKLKASWIGTTNQEPNAFLASDTGQRRFWCIEFPPAHVDSIVAAIRDNLNFDLMWRSVDGDHSLNPRAIVLPEMNANQTAELHAPSELESSVEECLLHALHFTNNLKDELNQVEAYPEIERWCADQKRKPPSREAIQDYLNSFNPKRFAKRENGKKRVYLGYTKFRSGS